MTDKPTVRDFARLRELVHAIGKHGNKPGEALLSLYPKCKPFLSDSERAWCERVAFGSSVSSHVANGNVLFTRRSVRRWTEQPIGDGDLHAMAEAARWAPSGCNRQPIELVAIRQRETIEAIASARRQPFIAGAPCVLAVVVAMESYKANAEYFALLDTGAAVQNMLLAAEQHALGACWVNMAPTEPGFAAVHAMLGTPEHYRIASLVAVGHPAEHPYPPGRKGMQIHAERFSP